MQEITLEELGLIGSNWTTDVEQDTTISTWVRTANNTLRYQAVFIACLYSTIIIPVLVCIANNKLSIWYWLMLLSDVIMLIDLSLQFVTPYKSWCQVLITDPKQISIRYICSWFLFDLLSIIPLYYILDSPWAFLSLIRVVRLRHIYIIMEPDIMLSSDFMHWYMNHPLVSRVFSVIISVLYINHYSACLFVYLLPSNTEFKGYIMDDSIISYLIGFYFSVSTLTTVGYGDVIATTPTLILLTIILMLVGSAVFGYFVAVVASLIANNDRAKLNLYESLANVHAFSSRAGLNKHSYLLLAHEITMDWEIKTKKGTWGWSSLREILSSKVRKEVANDLFHSLIKSAKFFTDLSQYPDFVSELTYHLTPELFKKHEAVGIKNTIQDKWYVCATGEILCVLWCHPNIDISCNDHHKNINTRIKDEFIASIMQEYNSIQKIKNTKHIFHSDQGTFSIISARMTLGESGIFSNSGFWSTSLVCLTRCALFSIEKNIFLSICKRKGRAQQLSPIDSKQEKIIPLNPLQIILKRAERQSKIMSAVEQQYSNTSCIIDDDNDDDNIDIKPLSV